MYTSILFAHSIFRWLVLSSLVYTTYRCYTGWLKNKVFDKYDNTLRHLTATISHIQLAIGYSLYFQSPLIKYFFANFKESVKNNPEIRFFALIHIILMTISIVIITIGSSSAKRKSTDKEKFKTIYIWFTVALIIIFISIPWPFSPFANRPYLRAF